MKVAALFVETDGCYYGLPDVDPWDEARDARKYAGPWPVVAHPPCQRWGKLWAGQPLWIKRTGERKRKGDDGGCFEAALTAARTWGGIIEHPWGSHAWPHFGLNTPARGGGWITADFHGGWTCCVEQGATDTMQESRRSCLPMALSCQSCIGEKARPALTRLWSSGLAWNARNGAVKWRRRAAARIAARA